jgi:hypothetical protein
MVALLVELSCVAAYFLWMYRRQSRDRDRRKRVPMRQMPLELEKDRKD